MNKNKYIYDSINKFWYHFNKYGIFVTVENVYMKKKLIKSLLLAIETKYYKLCESIGDDDKTKLTKIYFEMRKYILKNKSQDNTIEQVKSRCEDRKIDEKINNNVNIFAFDNGVFDFSNCEFRKGKIEEYITLTCGYNYTDELKQTTEEIMKIFSDIIPDEETRNYLLNTISTGLLGTNKFEEFYIWIGTAQNGKGLTSDLIKGTLGKYFNEIPIEYLTKTTSHHKTGTEADPVMSGNRYTRFCVATEPESEVHLRCAKLKQISGNDGISCRQLYHSEISFRPMFKLVIQSNSEPVVDGTDKAIIRRLRLIRFPISFVDEPKNNFERKVDRDLKTKIQDPRFKIGLFHILKNQYINVVAKIERMQILNIDSWVPSFDINCLR